MLLVAAVACLACNEQIYVEEPSTDAPEVESFSPTSGPVGTVVTVVGKHLNNVNKAYVNGVEVPLYERVSDTQLSFTVSAEASTGKIKLENQFGSYTTEDVFTYTYAVPEIIGSALAESAEMGGVLLVSGKNLNAVVDVLFTAEGYAAMESCILEEMERRMAADPNIDFWTDEESIAALSDDQPFYFTEEGTLVIVYDKYTVAPGSMGNPTFEIPKTFYQQYLK